MESSKKILDFHAEGPSLAARYLQCVIKRKNLSWSVEHRSEWPEAGVSDMLGAQMVLVDLPIALATISQFPMVPTLVRALQLFDTLALESGKWVPRFVLHEALRLSLIQEARDLDVRAPGFVIGSEPLMRVAVAVLIELGVKEIFLVGDIGILQSHLDLLGRSYLGVLFHLLPADELTLQTTGAGVVINTARLETDPALLTDLSYFNFMKFEGFALDMASSQEPNSLLEEAERAQLRIIPYQNIMRRALQLWIQKLDPELALSEDDAKECWKEFLR